MASAIRFRSVSLHYGSVRALEGVNLEIGDGEFFGILGPSGSGKTSCLRLIAGFEQPTAGSIELHGRPAERLPPYDRDVNTVFQDYALFPHMNVEQTVAYAVFLERAAQAQLLASIAGEFHSTSGAEIEQKRNRVYASSQLDSWWKYQCRQVRGLEG